MQLVDTASSGTPARRIMRSCTDRTPSKPVFSRPLWERQISRSCHGLEVSADGSVVIVWSDEMLAALDGNDGARKWHITRSIADARFSVDGQSVLVADAKDGVVVVLDASSGQKQVTFLAPSGGTFRLWNDLLPGAFYIGNGDGQVWQAELGTESRLILGQAWFLVSFTRALSPLTTGPRAGGVGRSCSGEACLRRQVGHSCPENCA